MDPLINQQGIPPQPMEGPQMPMNAKGPAQPEGAENEEDDEEWMKAEIALKRVLFEGGAIKDIVKRVVNSDDQANAIADSAFGLMLTLDEKTGGQIPEDYLLPLATVLIGEIAEATEAAGAPVQSEALATALKLMLEQHMSDFGASPEEIQEFTSKVDMKQLVEAMDQARSEADGSEESGMEEEPEMEEEPTGAKPLIGG